MTLRDYLTTTDALNDVNAERERRNLPPLKTVSAIVKYIRKYEAGDKDNGLPATEIGGRWFIHKRTWEHKREMIICSRRGRPAKGR